MILILQPLNGVLNRLALNYCTCHYDVNRGAGRNRRVHSIIEVSHASHIPGRDIADTICGLRDNIWYVEKDDVEAYCLTLDQDKDKVLAVSIPQVCPISASQYVLSVEPLGH